LFAGGESGSSLDAPNPAWGVLIDYNLLLMLKDRTNQRIDYAAIHRALLAGLLGNVGYKSDAHEYTGAQGKKFSVFPGSVLFKRKPQWLMSAELVERTKLYARTNAKVQAEWIERAAEHLVKRTYSEPRWDEETANVVADEKVMLYGLPIVPRRVVNYGPIDPKAARTIFIHHALVEGAYRTAAPFFAHNRRLVEEVLAMEAKTRNREYLVEAEVQFEFYDRRLGHDVFNGQTFERWRRNAERHNPKLLFMTRRDLMKRSADEVTPEAFPDFMLVAGSRLSLTYHLDPGEVMDGVTVTIPLAALNQLPDEPFEWLVPGLLREKVLELIRTLPKALRVNFVPAPEFADRAVEALALGEGSLHEALGIVLGKFSGLPVAAGDFDPASLPDFLKMNLRIIDQQGRTIQTGRDLSEIRRKLGLAARATFEELPPHPEFHRDNLKRWDFGDLPARIEIKRNGVTLGAHPALVDNAESVSLRLFDSPEVANASHRAGVRRLFMIQLGPELRHLWRNIRNFERMAMNYKLLGSTDELRGQIVTAAADRAFAADGNIRTQNDFANRALTAWRSLSEEHNRISEIADQALLGFYAVSRELSREFAPLLEPCVQDMREHLARLMPRDFVLATPPAWLPHLPRFIKGIGVRLERLTNAGLVKDQQGMEQIVPLERAYQERLAKHARENVSDEGLVQYRWMLEEFRISLFAQELKTSIPISAKRLSEQWVMVKG
jgi:ATP-dependent helicase HrpA